MIEDDRGPALALQRAHQLEDLGLDRHVERGRRLVGDQQLRLAGQRHRDHRALPHAARQPMRMLVEALRGRRDAHPLEHLERALRRLGAADAPMPQQPLDDLLADRERRVQRRHRLLEDHRDAVAAQVAHRRRLEPDQLAALEADRAAGDAAGRRRHQPHDRERRDALAAARFADDGERAARLDREAHAVDRRELARVGDEVGAQVADFEQRAHPPVTPFAARKASIRCSISARSITPAGRPRPARQATNGWKRSRLSAYSRRSSATGSA